MISLRIDELNLTDEEMRRLRSVIEETADSGGFQENLERIAKAAFLEYVEMLLGKQLPRRADEIRERRLFLLLKHYFQGRIPSESVVSQMFQLNERQSSSLIRNVRVKHKFELEIEMENTIRAVLASAEQEFDGGPYTVVITSSMILEELRQTVTRIAPTLGQILKVANAASVYLIPADTYKELMAYYQPTRIQLSSNIKI